VSRYTNSARVYSTVDSHVDVRILNPGSAKPEVLVTGSPGTDWLVSMEDFRLWPPLSKRDGSLISLKEASYLLRAVQEFLCHPTVEGQLAAEENIRRLFRRSNLTADPPTDIDLM
jgi:hypothetical protein